MAEGALTSILAALSEFFTWCLGLFGDIIDVIVSNPILLIVVLGMPICGFVFGLIGRLFRL